MDKYESAIEELCVLLDTNVYLPVKQELSGQGVEYSLGAKKEIFKGDIERVINALRGESRG